MITFIIAVAGFLMSLATWLRELVLYRNRIDLEIIDYTQYRDILQFFLRFRNKSSLPAYIAKISISSDKELWHDCELEPKRIKKTPSGYEAMTPRIPISLPPISFSADYFEFLGCQGTSLTAGKQMFFQIHTSRGILEKSLKLSEPGNYLHSK